MHYYIYLFRQYIISIHQIFHFYISLPIFLSFTLSYYPFIVSHWIPAAIQLTRAAWKDCLNNEEETPWIVAAVQNERQPRNTATIRPEALVEMDQERALREAAVAVGVFG